MNVNDFPDVPLPEGDMLEAIFAGQDALLDKYHEIEAERGFIVVDRDMFGELDHRFVQARIKDLKQRCDEELDEAMNCLKNKPWKQTETPTDATHFYEEVADALHFFVEMCLTAGFTAEGLAKMYFRKHAVNEFRQESRY